MGKRAQNRIQSAWCDKCSKEQIFYVREDDPLRQQWNMNGREIEYFIRNRYCEECGLKIQCHEMTDRALKYVEEEAVRRYKRDETDLHTGHIRENVDLKRRLSAALNKLQAISDIVERTTPQHP